MAAQLSQNLLLAVPLAPLVGAVLAGFFGKSIGRAGAHSVTILGVLISFVLSAMVLNDVLAGARFNATIYEWMNLGGLKMEIGFLVDGLTAMMMVVVTMIIMVMRFTETLFAMEHKKVHPERIEGGDEHTGKHRKISKPRTPEMACMHRFDDAVLGVKTGKERRADQRKRTQ